MMRIYYDINSDRIILGDSLTGASNSSLVAVDFDISNNKVGIRYKDSTTYEVVVNYADIFDINNNSVGNNKYDVLLYLNVEFSKTKQNNTNTAQPIIIFDKAISGTVVNILKTEHQISEICSIVVRNSSGKRVDVVDILNDNNLTLLSNVDLTNYTVRITGFSTIKKYIKSLNGLISITSKEEHGIDNIITYEVRDNQGVLVDVVDLLNTINNTITIQSNVNLSNCTLTIKGI